MAVVALVMASWWIFEVLPLGITGLVPVVAYPFLDIMSAKKIAPIYMSSILLLFVGGFFVALAMQRWNLHKRIALTVISFFGSEPKRLLLGFMWATGFLSMWISNTASTVMMVSIGLAVIKNFEEREVGNETAWHFSSALMMGIAYSATIGGITTLIGTPPNLAFTRIFTMSFPDLPEVSFGKWIVFGIPISLTLLAVAWGCLVIFKLKKAKIKELGDEVIDKEIDSLGEMKYEEKWVLAVFTLMACLWIFRKDLNLGFLSLPGWSNLLANPKYVDDGAVAVLCALILFMIPSRNPCEEEGVEAKRILDQNSISQIPWSTILLFGGGFALAKGIQSSGLSQIIGDQFKFLEGQSSLIIIASLTAGMSFLTELTSNMASTEMILPILASIAKSANINPASLMIPATLAASCAFMLPAATAPNAIIFGSRKVKIKDMVKIGFIINCVSIIVISLFSTFLIPHLI
jgi:sodium-dependent dicarboxylate transporter 2/3/5